MRTDKTGTASALRSGVTLVELLIVMGILTILATISLGTVKGLLKDQKISQAARLTEQYMESARVRALVSGRPVAVFLERVGVTGDQNGAAVSANFTATRLSIGEVFPPYAGDTIGTRGTFNDTNADGHADQIIFNPIDVISGFGTNGTNGFVQPGDTIEFEGYDGQFALGTGSLVAGEIVVPFVNPPLLRRTPVSLPVNITHRPQVGFRIFRRPTKSLVGAITLPRGTCVDLSASGLGPRSVGGGELMVNSPFSLTPTTDSVAPGGTGPLSPASYSRIAIMFSGEGRLASVITETRLAPAPAMVTAFDANQILYLMIGRTDQVVPVGSADLTQLTQSLRQRSPVTDADPVRSNLLDSANVWITCNPFTGELKSAPVAEVSDALLGSGTLGDVVRSAKTLAIAGIREQ